MSWPAVFDRALSRIGMLDPDLSLGAQFDPDFTQDGGAPAATYVPRDLAHTPQFQSFIST